MVGNGMIGDFLNGDAILSLYASEALGKAFRMFNLLLDRVHTNNDENLFKYLTLQGNSLVWIPPNLKMKVEEEIVPDFISIEDKANINQIEILIDKLPEDEKEFLFQNREYMNPIKFLDWYVRNHNDDFSRFFAQIRSHIKKLDKWAFRNPLDREKSIFSRIKFTYNQIMHSRHRRKYKNFYGVYAIIQTRDFRGNILPRPPVEIGYTTKPLGITFQRHLSVAKSLSFSQLLEKNYGNVYLSLKRFSVLKSKGIFITSNAKISEYFKIIPIDIAASWNQLKKLEIFYQMYINREQTVRGYNLDINMRFNAIIGDKVARQKPVKLTISKSHIESTILLGFRKSDICAYFLVGESKMDEILKLYWPRMNFAQIQEELFPPYLRSLAHFGVQKEDLVNYFMQGALGSRVTVHWSKLDSAIISQLHPYTKYQVNNLLKRCLGSQGEYNRIYINLYLKPLLLSLHQTGVITRDILIRALKYSSISYIGPLKIKPGSGTDTLAISWLFEYLFRTDIEEVIIREGFSPNLIREIALILGMYDPLNDSKSVYQRIYNYIKRSINRIFGTDDIEKIYQFLISKKL